MPNWRPGACQDGKAARVEGALIEAQQAHHQARMGVIYAERARQEPPARFAVGQTSSLRSRRVSLEEKHPTPSEAQAECVRERSERAAPAVDERRATILRLFNKGELRDLEHRCPRLAGNLDGYIRQMMLHIHNALPPARRKIAIRNHLLMWERQSVEYAALLEREPWRLS